MLLLFFEICTKTLSIVVKIFDTEFMQRILKHLLFWLIIILWTSTVYLSKETDGWEFVWFNLIRLPLLMTTTYLVIYGLLPKFVFKQQAYTKFASSFVLLFVVTTLLDRWLIGSELIATILKDTDLTYTFFNEIPLIRNAFLLLSVIGLAVSIRMFNFYQQGKERQVSTNLLIEDKTVLTINKPVVKPTPIVAIAEDFLLKSGAITHKLKWQDVYFLEKDENYVTYHTKEKRVLQRTTLSKLGAHLPDYFCRVHRSFIISLQQIDKIEKDFLLIKGQKIPIGRTYKAKFLERIAEFDNLFV